MVILTTRTLPGGKSFDETEWTRTRNALDYLDLADYDGSLFEWYEKSFHINHFYKKTVFQTPWIMVTGLERRYPMDDCRVLFKWFSTQTDSIFFNLSMKSRDPDWLGRGIFLCYFYKVVLQNSLYLESGESSVNFLRIATLCGFNKWRKTSIKLRRTANHTHRVTHYILSFHIYPSIVRGLYQNREKHPLLIKTFWDMFCISHKTRCMLFAKIPDAQHLEFLLDVANQTRFNFWGIRDGEVSYFEGALACFIVQERFHLLTILLRHGFTFKGTPLTLIKTIIKNMFPFEHDFTASPEFKEMFRKLLVSLPFPFETPRILRDKLLRFYTCLIIREEDFKGNLMSVEQSKRGRKILHRLVKAYATCGIDCDNRAPRTLKHQSRYVVRTLLKGNFQLPAGIDTLPVPPEVKEFLNLDS